MDSQEAFDVLLNAVKAAIDDSLARHAAATQRGDLDLMDAELEQQRNLVSARNQLQTLQDLWPRLVGKRKPAEKPKPVPKRSTRRKKLKRGERTPQEVFVVPILQALQELGGRGTVTAVLDRVGELVSETLREHDFTPLRTGQTRWRNTTQWTRLQMKEEGLLADDSPRGTWEMTERGRAYLRAHATEIAMPEVPAHLGEAGPPAIPVAGLAIFARYKGQRYEATLYPDHRVRFRDREYESPGGAGLAIVASRTLNGWRFWRYVDEQGREHLISNLRG